MAPIGASGSTTTGSSSPPQGQRDAGPLAGLGGGGRALIGGLGALAGRFGDLFKGDGREEQKGGGFGFGAAGGGRAAGQQEAAAEAELLHRCAAGACMHGMLGRYPWWMPFFQQEHTLCVYSSSGSCVHHHQGCPAEGLNATMRSNVQLGYVR